MDLPSTVNAPRICHLDGKVYWVRALSVEAMGIILAWLDDVLPGRDDRIMPPLLSDEASQNAIKSPTGQALMIWLAIRDQGITYDNVTRMRVTDIEYLRLLQVLYQRRRTIEVTQNTDHEVRDVGATWCSEGMVKLAYEIGLEALVKLSVDQFEWLMARGEVDSDPAYSPENLAKIQAEWREKVLPAHQAWLADQQSGVNGG